MDGLFLSLSLAVILLAIFLLIFLFVIDLRVYLLPDRYVFPLGILGIIFHTLMHFSFLSPMNIIWGAVVGGGLLYAVRWGGTKYYKQEAMGLGDVKLLTAAGIWLGPEHVVTAIMVGATAGLFHGLGVATFRAIKTGTFSIERLVIPAGPGFIIGIVFVFIYIFGLNYMSQFHFL